MKLRLLSIAAMLIGSTVSIVQAASPGVIPSPPTPVQVMNDDTKPVPVTIQGTGAVSGTVTVTNTSATPLFVDGVVDTLTADTTTTLFKYVGQSFGISTNFFTKDYKSVRVIAYNTACNNGCTTPIQVTVFSKGSEQTQPAIPMDRFVINPDDDQLIGNGTFATRVYEVPGEVMLLDFRSTAGISALFGVNVVVFGRRN